MLRVVVVVMLSVSQSVSLSGEVEVQLVQLAGAGGCKVQTLQTDIVLKIDAHRCTAGFWNIFYFLYILLFLYVQNPYRVRSTYLHVTDTPSSFTRFLTGSMAVSCTPVNIEHESKSVRRNTRVLGT